MQAATHSGPSSHGRGSASGKLSLPLALHSLSPVLFGPLLLLHQLLSQLYKLSLFSLLFSSTPTLALREGGKGGEHAKRCGIYLSLLAPIASLHKALWPFLHAFLPSSLSLKTTFFFASLYKKAALVVRANLSLFWPTPPAPFICSCMSAFPLFFFLF